jgi:ABC-2 type transport system permease protein
LLRGLTTRDEFRLRLRDSAQDMQDAVGESTTLALGLVLPPEFHQAMGSGEVVRVEGIAPHWADPAEVAELAAFFEQELSKASWQTVEINVAGNAAYPPSDAGGQPFLVAMNFSLMVLMMGLSLVPYLLIEEKETHTFDALMVSPASFSQVVIGKALTGIFYCLTAALVIFLFNTKVFVHWDIAILAVVSGALFAVSVGLLAGAVAKNQATVNLWMGLMSLMMLLPIFLVRSTSSRIPTIVQTVASWIPSVAFHKLLACSMAGNLDDAPIWLNVTILVGAALVVLALVVWQVRRSDR